MKLSEIEKKEMLEDAKSIKRRNSFRKTKQYYKPMTPEEYAEWLQNLPVVKHPKKRKFVEYINIKL